MIKKRLVIKLSGIIFNMENIDLIKKYAKFIYKLSRSYQPIVVTGGGKIARIYISNARLIGADESTLDELGTEVSRLNARLLICALKNNVYQYPPINLRQVYQAVRTGLIVVTGGLYPGQSTNGTAALIAERIDALKFFNVTNVGGIYDLDPNKNRNAKKFKIIKINELKNILMKEDSIAGSYDLLDMISLKIIERSKIKTYVLNANVKDLEKIINGDANIGTEIIC